MADRSSGSLRKSSDNPKDVSAFRDFLDFVFVEGLGGKPGFPRDPRVYRSIFHDSISHSRNF